MNMVFVFGKKSILFSFKYVHHQKDKKPVLFGLIFYLILVNINHAI